MAATITTVTMDMAAAPAIMCVECEDTEAAVRCAECADWYCALCFAAQHRAGSRLRHRAEAVAAPAASASAVAAVAPAVAETTQPQTDTRADEQADEQAEEETATERSSTGGSDSDEDMAGLAAGEAALEREAAHVPLRLTEEERALFNLLDAALNVSEYTDKVDVLSYRSPVKRVVHELNDMLSVLSGMMVASDFRRGRRLVQGRKFEDNEAFFRQVFEIGRRYKIMNPERMRDNYGKMVYLLQDANLREIRSYLGFSCVAPIKTVAAFLEERHALALLRDRRCDVATTVAAAGLSDADAAAFARDKQRAADELVRDYASASLSADDIRLCLNSIADSQSYLVLNRSPITAMIEYLEAFFSPDKPEAGFSLEIRAGRNGARLSHSHASQYEYVLQSLLLWKNMTTSMLRLWWVVEEDLLAGGMYRLRDTGQGLNRVQHAPKTSHLVHSILHHTQQQRSRWVGSSVVHLGDHNVPNALMFIDKYTQISRILSPIVNTIREIPLLAAQPNTQRYIHDTFGGVAALQKTVLCDFFKHGFDGSGADNFFDAGSCIDGRLTSAWNWCSKIEKKPFFHVFLMAGFVGFDGHFEK